VPFKKLRNVGLLVQAIMAPNFYDEVFHFSNKEIEKHLESFYSVNLTNCVSFFG
jgi:hypothetical protein